MYIYHKIKQSSFSFVKTRQVISPNGHATEINVRRSKYCIVSVYLISVYLIWNKCSHETVNLVLMMNGSLLLGDYHMTSMLGPHWLLSIPFTIAFVQVT